MQYLVCYFFHFLLGRFGRQPQDSREHVTWMSRRQMEKLAVSSE